MKEWLKDKFAFFYKRYTWGYGLMAQGVSLFNFVGIWSLVLGPIVRSYIFIPFAMFAAMGLSIGIGWIMFDKLRFKTRFTEQEGIRDDYWYGKLKPNQQMIYTMILDCIEDKNKVKEYRSLLKSGQLDFSEFKEKKKG